MKKLLFSIILLTSLNATAGDKLNLDQHKGKVIYLDFWASWCGPCKESFPWLNKLTKENPDVVVIGVNLDKKKKDAKAFLSKYPADFKVVYNPSGDLAEKYKVRGMPYSIILDKEGKKRHSHIGFSKEKSSDYMAEIKKLLGDK